MIPGGGGSDSVFGVTITSRFYHTGFPNIPGLYIHQKIINWSSLQLIYVGGTFTVQDFKLGNNY